jgi:hypothetical protein
MKVIHDPVSGIVEISSILPVIDTPAFQALDEKRQLGMTHLVFRGAKHSRLNHSIGSFSLTRKLANRWELERAITPEEGAALSMFALVHDVGHSAFSHTTEDFCLKDHHETTIDLIENDLRRPIEACGVNASLVLEMARRRHPLHKAVTDKNIGMEKLDYLGRDGLATGMDRPAGIDYVRQYVYFGDGELLIEKKIVDHVLDIMNFYMKMYKNVYLRKALVIAQRMFHKAVHHSISMGELHREDLPFLTDAELLGIMHSSKSPKVRHLYMRLRERNLYKEGVVFRTPDTKQETRIAGKSITVVEMSAAEMRRASTSSVLQRNNHDSLERLESLIEEDLGLPPLSILVVPVFYPERFEAQDVKILHGSGNIYSLKERRPEHFKAMEETARSYTALRICTADEYRSALSTKAAAWKVEKLLYSFLS